MTARLLDTHVLIWLLTASDRLGPQARTAIEAALQSEALYVSAITPWEIAMLTAKGRLALDRDIGEWIEAAFAIGGLKLAPLLPEISVASTRLPEGLHPDPADRIIVATARHLGATLITEDGLLLDYAARGHLKAQKAGS